MMAGRILFCFFVLSLLVENCSSFKSMFHFYYLPGENFIITCYDLTPGPWRIFCRENCQGENVIFNVTSSKAERGRHSIEYHDKVQGRASNLTVKVYNLTASDSGLYRLGLSYPQCKFTAVVPEALLNESKDHHLYKVSGSSLTVACSFNPPGTWVYFCRGECEEENILIYTRGVRARRGRHTIGHTQRKISNVYVSIQNLTSSDSGQYRCLSSSNYSRNSHVDFRISVSGDSSETADPSHLEREESTDYTLIVVIVILSILVLLLSAALIASRRRKRSERGLEMRSYGGQQTKTVASDWSPDADLIDEDVEPASSKESSSDTTTS